MAKRLLSPEMRVIKDQGTVNRFREASRLVDIGHQAVYEAIRDGGYKGMMRPILQVFL